MKKHLKLFIEGIVQGVGFRPFVYNLAKKHEIKGYVLNDSRGVTIEAEGSFLVLEKFKDSILNSPPPLSQIQNVCETVLDSLNNYTDFYIKKSNNNGKKTVLISPDVSICSDCLYELNNPKDPRYHYPFINCTNCGPRFTIIKDVPYDRKNTTMEKFPMCSFCNAQYEDPKNRRFHAQPVACPECGPKIFLFDNKGNKISSNSDDIIKKSVKLFKDGKIIAIKGLGGYHLAADAKNRLAINRLRIKKFREDKPFALMAPSIDIIGKYCFLNSKEKEIIASYKRPIVLLKKKEHISLSQDVAPNNIYLGFMLPYTPLHYLIMEAFNGVLVMTSGNVSDEPICYNDKNAFSKLKNIADYFITNNRDIFVRTDDSVIRIFKDKEYLIRRSRGYAPFPIVLKDKAVIPILAFGAQLKNTFCLYKGNNAFVSHHIGDLENLEALNSLKEGIKHYLKIFDIKPQLLAYDLHPRYMYKNIFSNLEYKSIYIQHHHAHAVAVMADRNLKGDVIAVTFDGLGYGDDGNLWGCEFLRANKINFKRLIHLDYTPLPGGEAAIKNPWQMAISYLYKIFKDGLFDLPLAFLKDIDENRLKLVLGILKKKINSPLISSSGRLFDAVAAIVGIRSKCSFEGQGAIEMEALADFSEKSYYSFEIIDCNDKKIIKPDNIFIGIISDLKKNIKIETIAGKFHNTMAQIILEGVILASLMTSLKKVVLSGGVFQNVYLLRKAKMLLEEKSFDVYIHNRVPTNDGGVSLGQALIASERYKKGI